MARRSNGNSNGSNGHRHRKFTITTAPPTGYSSTVSSVANTATAPVIGASSEGGSLSLATTKTKVKAGDSLGKIEFKAPIESGLASSTSQQEVVAASIEAKTVSAMDSKNVPSELVFNTGTPTGIQQQMTLNSVGYLGIGTAAPIVPLHLLNTNPTFIVQSSTPLSSDPQIQFKNSSGALLGSIRTHTTNGSLNHISFNHNGSSNDIVINNSGSIGIGTPTPTSKLHVKGNITLDGDLVPASSVRNLGSPTARWKELFLSEGTLHLGDNCAISTANNTIIMNKPIASSGSIEITAPSSTPLKPAIGRGYIYSKTNGRLYWRSHDLEEIEISSTNNVANAMENRLVTVGYNINQLEGETDLTFDGSKLSVQAGMVHKRRVILSSTTIMNTDYYLAVYPTATVTLSLPSASSLSNGQTFVVKDEGGLSGLKKIIIATTGMDTIDGQSTIELLSENAAISIYTDGTQKYFIY